MTFHRFKALLTSVKGRYHHDKYIRRARASLSMLRLLIGWGTPDVYIPIIEISDLYFALIPHLYHTDLSSVYLFEYQVAAWRKFWSFVDAWHCEPCFRPKAAGNTIEAVQGLKQLLQQDFNKKMEIMKTEFQFEVMNLSDRMAEEVIRTTAQMAQEL
jgi:hypothetical protein